jgi:hypothetical protein
LRHNRRCDVRGWFAHNVVARPGRRADAAAEAGRAAGPFTCSTFDEEVGQVTFEEVIVEGCDWQSQ